jgi:hypothetical protein
MSAADAGPSNDGRRSQRHTAPDLMDSDQLIDMSEKYAYAY